jgi:hypothetical protein
MGPRRNIALTLRQLRDNSGKLLTEVAGDLLISTSKLSRLENAQGKPRLRDIRDLIRYYGIEGTPQAEQLRRWMDAAEQPVWWTDYGDEVVEGMYPHVAYEADAAVERAYTLPFVPALLQTEDYAGAVFRQMEHHSEDKIRRLVTNFRVKRQEVLDHREGLDPLKFVVVTHESALRQAVGSPEILRDQLDTLVERSKSPNVKLHILPFEAGPVFTMTCMYAYFEYQDAGDLEQDIVYIETHAGFLPIEDPSKVADYRTYHDELVKASLDEDDSRRLIRSVRDVLAKEQ